MASAPVHSRSGIEPVPLSPTVAEPFPAMIRLPARIVLAASAALAINATMAAPLAAQQSPGTFTLPPPSPTPTPAPAGPNDERAGVVIPPRAAPTPRITPVPVLTPEELASPSPRTAPTAAPTPTPNRATTGNRPAPAASPAPTLTAAPSVSPSAAPGAVPPSGDPLTLPPSIPGTLPEAGPVAADPPAANTDAIFAFSAWELIAAGGVGALAVLGAGLLVWRRRKPKVQRLAAPSASASGPAAARGAEGGQTTVPDLADLHLSLDITTATRSLMMFTLGYRLNIANRSGRAVSDVRVAAQLVCARAIGASAPSAGAAQALGEVERIGPHQARSIAGELQLPLSAIQPLRQGTTPLFVPLVHVTIEAAGGEGGQPAVTKTFVIGSPSAGGRVHPIKLDQPPGGIAGLVAQAVAVPSASAAA